MENSQSKLMHQAKLVQVSQDTRGAMRLRDLIDGKIVFSNWSFMECPVCGTRIPAPDGSFQKHAQKLLPELGDDAVYVAVNLIHPTPANLSRIPVDSIDKALVEEAWRYGREMLSPDGKEVKPLSHPLPESVKEK